MTDETTDVPGVPAADTPSASTPAPLSDYAPGFDPFADAKGGQELSQAPTPLLERMRLHFKEAQTKGTIFGAASQLGAAAVERGAIARGTASDAENEAIDRAVKTRNDLESYDRMPGSEGFLDYGAALVGQLAGGITSPESLIGDVAKVPVWLGSSALGRIGWFGANQAVVQTAVDPAIQGLNIAGGARDEYSAYENFVEKPIGGLVGGALLKGAHEAGTALFVRPQAEKDALTFFQTLRDHGGADEQKRWPEIYNEVQGKSDSELGGMAKEIAKDDKAAGDNAKPVEPEQATTPQEAADNIAKDAPAGSETIVDINGERATGRSTVRQPATEEPALAARAGETNEGIGDALAAQHNSPDGTLDIAVRKTMEASLPRDTEAAIARSGLTTNMVEAPNLRESWTSLANAFKAVVRQGRLQSKKAAGEFTLKSGVIRMKQLDDLTVFAHELGHHAEYTNPDLAALIRPPPKATAPNPQLPDKGAELDALTAYAAGHKDPKVRRSEGFAEFFRLFVEHPAEAQRRAPGFFDEFNKYLDGKPEYKAALEKAQRDFDNYRMANASDLVDANIHTSAIPKGWEKIRNDVRNQGFWNTITDHGSMIYTGLIDEKNPLAVAVRELLKMQKDNKGKIISLIAADDPYKLMRLAQNAHQSGMVDLIHGVSPYRSNTPEGPSMYDAIALATGKPNVLSGWDEAAVQQFSGYLIARRGVFEWERRMAGLHKQDPMPMAKDIYETKIREYEAANPNARQAAEMVHGYAHNLLKKEYDAGLITSDSYDLAMQIRDYVPLMRDMSEKSARGEGDFNAANVGLKQFRGSSRPIIDPIESLIARSFRTAQLIAHNDGIKALATLADKAGVGAGRFVERVSATEIKAKYVDPLEAIRKGLSEAGVSEADAKLALTEMLDNLMVDEQSIGPVSIFRSQQAAARGENLVFYLSGGEMKALRLKEGDFGRDLVNNLTSGMSTPLRDWNLQGLAKVAKILRAGVVTSPDFFITNTLRDQLATWILNRGTIPLIDSMRGIYREVMNTELSRTMAQMGGIAGGANLNGIDHARMDKDIQALATKGFTVARVASFEGYFKLMELSETSSRLGLFGVAYKRALKQGLSPYEASVEAAFTANDNLDFGRHGSRIGDTLKIIPFMNAQLQGLDKAFRTLVSPLFKEKLTTQDAEAQKTMLSAYTKIAALTGLSMALRAAYIDDPEYSEFSDYMRNNNWMVRIPGVKGNKIIDMLGRTIEVPPGLQNLWLAIPKPFELAILPNLGERAVETLANKDPTALARWAWGAKDLVASKWMMDSVGVKIPFELYTGKDTFTGRDIVPEHVAGREPWMQATAGTSEIAKAIGKAADKAERALGMDGGGLSPMYIDHLIKGVGGSWGRNFLSMSDAAIGDKGDQSLANTAIARRVFKEAYNGSVSSDIFWKTVGKTNGVYSQAANTYDALASNPAEQASYAARLPEDRRAWVIMDKSDFPADEKRLHPLHRAHDAITTLSNMQREIADRNLSEVATLEPIQLSSSEQRVAIDGLNRIRMWEARNALIVAGHPALKGQKLGNVDAEMEMLRDTVPTVYNELAQRYANAKVYKASSVAEHWDEVKQAVIDDGSAAHLRGIAADVRRDGYELDEHASKKKKVRPVIPGALDAATQ